MTVPLHNLLFVCCVLLPCATVQAQSDDDIPERVDPGDPDEQEARLPIEGGLRLLGKDRGLRARESLAEYEDGQVARAAEKALRSSRDPREVLGAAVYLGQSSAERAGLVRRRLEEANSPELKGALIEALGVVGEAEDLWKLNAMIRDADTALTGHAARALCRSSQRNGLNTLVDAARRLQNDPERYAQVKAALRWMAQGEGAERLVRTLSLSSVTPELLEVLSHPRGKKARDAVRALAREGVDAVDPGRRAASLRLLASTQDRKSGELIITALADEELEVRIAAASSAWRLSLDDALPSLVELLRDETLKGRKAAHDALVRLTGAKLSMDPAAWEQLVLARSGAASPDLLRAYEQAAKRAAGNPEGEAERKPTSTTSWLLYGLLVGVGVLGLVVRFFGGGRLPSVRILQWDKAEPDVRPARLGTKAWTEREAKPAPKRSSSAEQGKGCATLEIKQILGGAQIIKALPSKAKADRGKSPGKSTASIRVEEILRKLDEEADRGGADSDYR